MIKPDGDLCNMLIISPPGRGKTTLLRDIARNLSMRDYKVAICDERSEIAGMASGVSPYTFGTMVDVLDGCPKAEGMRMLVRSMSPNVVIADEIGTEDDAEAVKTVFSAEFPLLPPFTALLLKTSPKPTFLKWQRNIFSIIWYFCPTNRLQEQ